MNKKLGIDFGTKTIGLAISCLNISMPFMNIENNDQAIINITNIIEEEMIDIIVLGLPLNASGSESDRTKLVKKFYDELKKTTSKPIYLIDERYTTKKTVEELKKYSYKSSKIKTIKDMNSACQILDEFEKGKYCE